jgi:glycosyltransferase involved in cell wall biosynthesis
VPPEISLVMPVWRPDPGWLHEAVRSALGQQDCDLELVVVDDGNDVPVAEVLAEVVDPRLRHLRIPHAGVSAARNAGIDVAKGRFVRFVDADDVLEPGSTARLRALARDDLISYEDTVVCDEQLTPRYRISSRLAGHIAVPCLLGKFDSRHVSMLFPAEVVRRAGPWDSRLRVRQDFDFVLRCLEHAAVVPGEGTATFYRRHDASATRSENAVRDAQRSSRIVVTGFFERHPELCGSPVHREAWARLLRAEAGTALDRGRPLAALRLATPLFRLAPRSAAGLYLRAGRKSLRLSGAASARTTARARAVLWRADR